MTERLSLCECITFNSILVCCGGQVRVLLHVVALTIHFPVSTQCHISHMTHITQPAWTDCWDCGLWLGGLVRS